MKTVFTTAITLLLLSAGTGLLNPQKLQAQNQYAKSDTMHWRDDRKLQWNDFKGKPKYDTEEKAATASGLLYQVQSNSKGELTYSVAAFMVKKESWVNPTTKTAYLLNHEQRHFDITEIYARRLRTAMKNYKLNFKTASADFQRMYDTINGERNEFQNQYDTETEHSMHAGQQQLWDEKIDKLLAETPYE